MRKNRATRVLCLFAMMFICAPMVQGASEAPMLAKPFGMCVNEKGQILVADIEAGCIIVLSPDLEVVRRVEAIEGYGPLDRPFDVKVWKDRYYILDTGHANLVVADRDWRMVTATGAGTAGSEPGQFGEPHCLDVADDGTVFVADTLNQRIQVFDQNLQYQRSIRGVAVGGEFPINRPTGIAVLDDERLVVCEYGSEPPRVIDRSGRVLGSLKSFGAAYCAWATADRIYIAWTYSDRVSAYNHEGELLYVLGNPVESDEPGQFNKPAGVTVDGEGNLYVAEWRNHRIQKFDRDGEWLAMAGSGQQVGGTDHLAKQPRLRADEPVRLGAFTRVLSPEAVRRYHDAGVDSLYFQAAEDLFSDRLKRAVDTAHELGMKGYMVFDAYFYGARAADIHDTPTGQHPFAVEHPEYFTLKRDGETPNRGVLSWVYPEVRRWKVEQIIAALERSGADGVVLDYIRWPAGNTEGYDPPAVERFTRMYGVSPFDVPARDPRWARLRSSYIGLFIAELRTAVNQLDRPVTIGAYVDADPEAEMLSVGRDWPTWSQMHLIDETHHMIYTDDFQLLYDGVRTGRRETGPGVRVVACVDVYAGFLHTGELLRQGARAAMLAGADEVVVVRDGAIERLDMFGAMKQVSEDFAREAAGQASDPEALSLQDTATHQETHE